MRLAWRCGRGARAGWGASPPGHAAQGSSWRTGGKHLLEVIQTARSRFHFTHSRPLCLTGPLFARSQRGAGTVCHPLGSLCCWRAVTSGEAGDCKAALCYSKQRDAVSPPASLRLHLCGPSCCGRALARLRRRHHPAEARLASAAAAAAHGFSLLPAPRLSAEAASF